MAIGKRGVNIKLASRLVGFEIDVYREGSDEEEGDFDIDLEEFSDEIEQWMIDDLKSIGCDTARSVLNLSREELIRRTDLEEEMVDDIIKILRTEFENEGEEVAEVKDEKAEVKEEAEAKEEPKSEEA